MNKRQKKKRLKEISRRRAFIKDRLIVAGRQNGKTLFINSVLKIINSKKYRPFKQLQKRYGELMVAIDLSNGKDMTAICHYRFAKGICHIVKVDYE